MQFVWEVKSEHSIFGKPLELSMEIYNVLFELWKSKQEKRQFEETQGEP